ncbi:RTA1-domain-containing protein [Lentithecium fluviatile CBS 122367]|uniref:RTA1-domain-containing protein n=1 Tax=Lentithecium fluviatile CBS 122367 TaxID=1168545 RepID=A0A6G1ITW9_9PLEO|nr:RTA1-domain-containing protein [Lentithecium fluviatile CBS 122367]
MFRVDAELVSRAAKDDDWKKYCTIATCAQWSYWAYYPSIAANSFFIVLFGLSTLLFIFQGMKFSRKWMGFGIAMVCGGVLEIIGYIGRIMANKDVFSENPFLMQIVCLTIGPAFMAAGIYLCLSRIVITFGPENSRIKPSSYPRIFIPCDVVSLLLQAIGGGIASVATHTQKSPKTGNNIMIAGLASQVFTLLVFILCAADFAFRTMRNRRQLGAEAFNASHPLRSHRKLEWFLIALGFATLCIFTRSVYRVAELSEGWTGHLIKNQKYFIAFEGALVGAAVVALNAFHPGFCFREEAEGVRKGWWVFRWSKRVASEQSSGGEREK